MTEIRKGMCPPARKRKPPAPPSSNDRKIDFQKLGDVGMALVTLLVTLGTLLIVKAL